MSVTAPAMELFARWLNNTTTSVGRHALSLLTENDGTRDGIMEELCEVVRSHYVAPEVIARRIEDLGAPATAALLREHLPTTKTARSGDLGEILATEIVERKIRYKVPVRRLRWKDGRNMALRGDDIIGVADSMDGGLLKFLKGESKSRARLNATTVAEASVALDRDHGNPTRHSVLFVADRLREQGEDEMAQRLEQAVISSFRGNPVEHLLFTVSGNGPETYLSANLDTCTDKVHRHAVGVCIRDHGAFIERLFSEL